MHKIAGYTLTEKIHESVRTIVYRGECERDRQPVVIKILNAEYPSLSEIIRLRNQYAIAKNLGIPGIIQPLRLENYQNSFALILEDFGGISLQNYITSYSVLLTDLLKIAIQIANTLDALHQNRIIHKDIKPHNILINPGSKQVKITDFSISSLLPKETGSIVNPNSLEGTLAYMSPEQTGRMNRGIDYRTDFYSLGVTYYEILTGQLPFATNDPMEMVHNHIAKQPISPAEINSAIPQMVSDIVMKLMGKTAESRYQSARGIVADLDICLHQLETRGKVEYFVLGQRDIYERFQIPEKLYGREAEIQTLMAAFDRVSKGGTEMMLVAGYSGIGKSALVHEVHKPIVEKRGYFISGKFDQFKRNIPFASVIEAFRDLIRQLLTESPVRIAYWKQKIAKTLGDRGRIITEVIPEVELIIGKQPPVAELPPTESQNRFNLVFQNFVRVFAGAEHPLVLFLDDLQWADSASLKLIELLMTASDTHHLFFIGAYRDNEVSSVHPTLLTIDQIQKSGTIVNRIMLKPLDESDLNRLISDALNCPAERAKPLGELVYLKTKGNPFFGTQFLTSLYSEGLLEYNIDCGYWQCDIAKVRALAVSDDVVEFMATQLQKLPILTQNVLKLAACIGHQFDLETLSIVYEKTTTETAADLWKALQSGLVIPITEVYKFFQDPTETVEIAADALRANYKFLHDRVQQAAYTLIPETEKKSTHLKIGRLLLQNLRSPEEIEDNIFELVNQLNIGQDLLIAQEEKNKLAELDGIAGRKAKLATAYEPAVRYLNVGLELLSADRWTTNYELSLSLYVATVEAEYLNINFERAQQLAEEVLQYGQNILDKVKVYELQILFYVGQNQPKLAINTAQSVLKMLGISLPTEPEAIALEAAKLKEELTHEIKHIEALADLPVMSDPYQQAALRILMNTLAPAYQTSAALLQLTACTMIKLSVQYGNSPQTIPGYGYYGVILCGVYGDLHAGYQFGQLAVKVWEKFNAAELKVKAINLFNGFVRYWKDHVKETLEPLQDSVQSGIETGDLEYGFYNAVHHGNHLFFIGEPLEEVERKQAQYIEMMQKLKLELHVAWNKIWNQRVLNLLDRAADPYQLVGERFDETEALPILLEKNNVFLLFCIYCCKTMLLYLFKKHKEAVEAAELGEQYEQAGTGLLYVTDYNFYYSLTLLADYCSADDRTKKRYLEKVNCNQDNLKKWAVSAPINFQHKYDLVEAEKARISGEIWEAMELYDCAIAGAKHSGYIQEEALANELAAEFYFNLKREKIAIAYLIDAYYGYARWGAIAKVRDLETRYDEYLVRITSRESLSSLTTKETLSIGCDRTTSGSTNTGSQVLDLATVMKASLAVSEEIVLDKLLGKLMRVILENAGAQKGFLILEKEGKLVIEATGTLEREEVTLLESLPVEDTQVLPAAIVHYVDRTQEYLVLNDAARESMFSGDPYIAKIQPQSILCAPIVHKGKRIGLIYLENNLSSGVFTSEKMEVLKLLSSQIAISLENATLYHNLQKMNEALQHSEAREREKAMQLEQSLHELKQAQIQLVQSEKMSTLGQLIAGVGHEINNPVHFIHGNLTHMTGYTEDLIDHVKLYREYYPNPVPEIQANAEAIDIDYLIEDLPNMVSSMKLGTQRISEIVKSLKNFSRKDADKKTSADLNEGIDSTLLILSNRLKSRGSRPAIEVIKEYGKLPLLECYPGQINQVFMNLIANAIDALEEKSDEITNSEESGSIASGSSPCIRICTEVKENFVVIRIADNGFGMTDEVKYKLFKNFFTTKPQGKGTGLGLSISYQIIVEKHGGQLRCISELGKGTEFIIELPIRP